MAGRRGATSGAAKRRAQNPYKRPDHFTKAAKSAGFPARSVFKLEEIDKRCRLLKQGQRVLDLGAAPGSWSLYALQVIGAKGRLVAIDLDPLTSSLGPNALVLQSDAFEVASDLYAEHGPFDVVLSDMAPRTTGMRETDQARSFELVLRALEIARAHGAPGSSFVAKIFMGPDFDQARAALREVYGEVRTIRPETVRKNSIEVFLVALAKR
ncbi:MAG: RlmE family RNA methyltransferase [Polyangiaceae bacterium]|nr:RlmE family RNA methyltransferase [Polyangiaceae bacterium]MBK8936726.1 RlmE family RNA methyltransferase [Polyangiaceae bacterium]